MPELAKQEQRKAELLDGLNRDLEGVESILFEAGCGHGHWLTSSGEAHPETICVRVDLISWRIRKAGKRDKRGLKNLFFYKAELGEFMDVLPEAISFERTVLLFPDPWPKAGIIDGAWFSAALSQVAERTSGEEFVRSDDRPYFDWTVEHLEEHASGRSTETQHGSTRPRPTFKA